MSISRRLGILIFSGVPAIIGGGIVYSFCDSFISIIVYEIILCFVVGAIVSK